INRAPTNRKGGQNMNAELQRARHRQMFIFLLVSFGMLVLLGRLYYWQILQSHSGYNLAQRANDEHIQNQVLDAPRGLIFDSQGHILATNIIRDDVYVEPVQYFIDHTDNSHSILNTLINRMIRIITACMVLKNSTIRCWKAHRATSPPRPICKATP